MEPIRNPSPQEIEKILNKSKSEKVEKVEPIKKSEISEWEEIDGALVKKRQSVFQPTPFKFKLPSSGITIKGSITKDKEIFVRKLGAPDEGRLASIGGSTSTFNKVSNEIIKSCIQSNVDYTTLCITDKIALFAFVIAKSYASKINVKDIFKDKGCKTCSDENSVTLDFIDDLEGRYLDENDFSNPFEIKLDSFPGMTISLFFTYPMIANEEYFNSENGMSAKDVYTTTLVDIKGNRADGTPISLEDSEEILNWWNQDDKDKYKEKMDKFSEYGNIYKVKKFECNNNSCEMKKKKKIEINLTELFGPLFLSIATRKND